MNQRPDKGWNLGAINRIAQANVALAICIGVVVRASMNFDEATTDSPDPIWVVAVFLAAAIALFTIPHLLRAIHLLRQRWQRIAAAVVSFGVQFALLQLLITFVAEN